MSRSISARTLVVLTAGAFLLAAMAQAQTTWYVDDDAPGDPGPGDSTISDPDEDGSPEHPFDAIQEAIFVSQDGDTVLVLDGTYTGLFNKDLDFGGLAITVRSENGPANCIIDCEGEGRGFYFRFGEGLDSIADGFAIINCYVEDSGAGIYCNESSPTITDCVMSGNRADSGGGAICCDGGSPTIANCTLTDNVSYSGGGGVSCYHSSPTIANCTIAGNTASQGGGIWCGYGSPMLTNCLLAGNTSTSYGGGGMYIAMGGPTVANCIFAENDAIGYRSNGGGVYCHHSDLLVTNSTFSGNSTDYPGGGLYFTYESTAAIIDCVLWGDIGGNGPEIALVISSETTVSYSDVEGGWAWVYISDGSMLNWGEGNIIVDPQFADPNNADYHLADGSPCIDAGDPDFVPGSDERDIDGQMRVWDGDGDDQWRVDMGSDEYGSHCPGDLDGDGDVDLSDLSTLLANYGATSGMGYEDGDLDHDGDVDLADLAALLSVYGTTCE